MKIFIEIPTWLGDAIMATPSVVNILETYPNAKLTFFGSFGAIEIYKNFPNVENVFIDDSKKSKNRVVNLFNFSKKMIHFDIAISFRSSFMSRVLLFFLHAKQKFSYKKNAQNIHQVLKYNNFINHSLHLHTQAGDLNLFIKKQHYKGDKKLLGLNPGATYGSAKRWYPQEFAKIAIALHDTYDIVIFGGTNETQISEDIENILVQNGIINYTNLSGKTTIKELCEHISMLDLFITNDSGPMHIAAAYKIKTITIFGPTNSQQTNQWKNPNEFIVRNNIPCSPCMKRECPLKHHECMKNIKAEDILALL